MASRHQIRGALLEEAILSLLRASGYRTIEDRGNDPTLDVGAAGLIVRGRGGNHQIDAIADFRVGQPFSNPQRLLVEGKYYSDERPIGLPFIRGAVGVLKDVGEFWPAPPAGKPTPTRYHYQYALFSASRFTKDAQDYAFAHDIFLLPLSGSSFFRPMLRSIDETATRLEQRAGATRAGELREIRLRVRSELQDQALGFENELFKPVVDACRDIGQALMATIGRGFPIFLVPREPEIVATLRDVERVRITWDAEGWYLYRIEDDKEPIFSFDLPEALFLNYADEGVLSPTRAVDLKAEYLNEIQAIHVDGPHIRVINFQLDFAWLERIRPGLRERRRDK